MNYQHKELSQGRWSQLTFVEQMANIGGEVERALNWRAKNNIEYSNKAAERALELIDLTIDNLKIATRFKEVVRLREAIADYFFGDNKFSSSELLWKKYFLPFAFAARKNHNP